MGRRDEGKEQFWRLAVAEHGQSGLSVREFCRRRELVENSFYAWRRELKLRDQAASSSLHSAWKPDEQAESEASTKRQRPPAAFLPLEVLPANSELLEVVLSGRVTVRVPAGFDRQTLAEVFSLLERAAC